MLGKFNSKQLAESFSNRTEKISAIVLGDDTKYWVVTLAEMNRLLQHDSFALTRIEECESEAFAVKAPL